jgi:anthranilate synthase component 2
VNVLVLDNHDSFTWNLVHLVEVATLGRARVIVRRSTEVDVAHVRGLAPDRIVISPGPGNPAIPGHAGISCDVVRKLGERVPILGVCLGHQAIGVAFGARIVQAPEILHGKSREILLEDDPLFRGATRPFFAMRYHSLVVDLPLPSCLVPIAKGACGTLMAMRHVEHPIVGVQFHPESIGTPDGLVIVRSFLERGR